MHNMMKKCQCNKSRHKNSQKIQIDEEYGIPMMTPRISHNYQYLFGIMIEREVKNKELAKEIRHMSRVIRSLQKKFQGKEGGKFQGNDEENEGSQGVIVEKNNYMVSRVRTNSQTITNQSTRLRQIGKFTQPHCTTPPSSPSTLIQYHENKSKHNNSGTMQDTRFSNTGQNTGYSRSSKQKQKYMEYGNGKSSLYGCGWKHKLKEIERGYFGDGEFRERGGDGSDQDDRRYGVEIKFGKCRSKDKCRHNRNKDSINLDSIKERRNSKQMKDSLKKSRQLNNKNISKISNKNSQTGLNKQHHCSIPKQTKMHICQEEYKNAEKWIQKQPQRTVQNKVEGKMENSIVSSGSFSQKSISRDQVKDIPKCNKGDRYGNQVEKGREDRNTIKQSIPTYQEVQSSLSNLLDDSQESISPKISPFPSQTLTLAPPKPKPNPQP